MSENKLIQENNRLKERLEPHNRKVYENILVYIRGNVSSRDDDTEAVLNDLLKDAIQAQREGRPIETVTGEDYRAYADGLVESLPKRNIWKFAGMVALMIVGANLVFDYTMQLLFMIIDGAEAVTTVILLPFILELIITAGLGFGFIYLLFLMFQNITFKDWPFWKEAALFLIIGVVFFILYILLTTLIAAIGIGPSFQMSIWLMILAGVTFFLVGLTALFRPEIMPGVMK